MTIYDVGVRIEEAFLKSFTPLNITSGFKNTGIYPYNRQIFDDEDFRGCEVTNRPLDMETLQEKETRQQSLRQNEDVSEQENQFDLSKT